MKDIVLEVKELRKEYKRDVILNGISFDIQKGHIYGLIGNNGAGKTSIFRLIAGLTRPQSGTISLFGETDDKKNEKNRKRCGFLVESPIFYPDLSASKNLMLQAELKGITDKKHIDELLSLVGLDANSGKKVKDYSTGMKQRYGIAFALIGWPELLILDEPLNGMDVSMMDKTSELFKYLCEEKNMTLIISSHLLSRLQQVATDYIILHEGSIIKNISSEELDKESRGMDLEDYFRLLINRR